MGGGAVDKIVDVLALWADDALEKHLKKKQEEELDECETEYDDEDLESLAALSEAEDVD